MEHPLCSEHLYCFLVVLQMWQNQCVWPWFHVVQLNLECGIHTLICPFYWCFKKCRYCWMFRPSYLSWPSYTSLFLGGVPVGSPTFTGDCVWSCFHVFTKIEARLAPGFALQVYRTGPQSTCTAVHWAKKSACTSSLHEYTVARSTSSSILLLTFVALSVQNDSLTQTCFCQIICLDWQKAKEMLRIKTNLA